MKISKVYFLEILLAILLFSGAGASLYAQEIQPTDRASVAPILEEITPAVVNISVTGRASLPQNPLFNDPFFRRFFDVPEENLQARPTQSVGSGVIINSAEGLVLTNHHVVKDAEEVKVTLQDQRSFDAQVLGSDAGTDIALLKIDADNLTQISLADSETLRVGDFVMAIGNPFGIGQTVTSGIVSALGRSGINPEGYEDFIQTDASINPGNSGGALVDYNGELIGINTAIIAPSGGNVGIGFAVPINMAMLIVDQLQTYGEISRGRLGVIIQNLTPEVAKIMELDVEEGAVVSSVQADTPAEEAGILAGDVIIKVDDHKIDSSSTLRNVVGLTRAGEDVEVTLIRDGNRMSVDVTLGEGNQVQVADNTSTNEGLLEGVELSSLPDSHPLSNKLDGVLVTSVREGSRAYRNGLQEKDIITAVNRQTVTSPGEVLAILEQNPGAVILNIVRGEQTMFMILR